LPAIARALESGTLSWSAIREVTRVAVPETAAAWLEIARGKTIRQLEDLVAGKHPGDTPTMPPDPSARRHVLRFEVTAETFALFREALGELRRRTGSSLDDDTALSEMARHVLNGPTDDGRSSYQIVLTVCAACRAGHQDDSGELVAVGSDIVAMASCDGQHIGHVDVRPANDAVSNDAPDQATTDVAGLPNRERTPLDSAHVGAPARAKQDVPGRDAVRRRSGTESARCPGQGVCRTPRARFSRGRDPARPRQAPCKGRLSRPDGGRLLRAAIRRLT
jgi:hypothetical protein